MAALVLYIRNWLKAQEGQDLVEYVLILGLIALAATVAITATGTSIQGAWDAVSAAVDGAVG